ncbi:hypothetical protein L7F22_055779 [Adiantum nelumboides]|nr:hypothetical protein [Adiantum nelumboides]
MGGDHPLPTHLQDLVQTYDRRRYGGWQEGPLPSDGVVFGFWGNRYMIAPSIISGAGRGLFITWDLHVPPHSEIPDYDIDNVTSQHSHNVSQMSIECMRILRRSDPNTYARLKEQYAKDFNGRDDIFDNDDGMADFIEHWHQNDSASDIPNNEKYLRKEALKCIYEGSQLTRLSASLLILNLQNRFGWSNVSVSAQLKRQAIHFNEKVEEDRCPIPNTPKDLYLKWTVGPAIDPESEIISGDDDDAVKVRARGKRSLAQSLSIWYTLEYWKDLKICHLLDPMHIFKNVGHSLWQHLVGFKDTAAARNDLKDRNSKPNLWPLSDETGRETTYEPAPWVLTAEEV